MVNWPEGYDPRKESLPYGVTKRIEHWVEINNLSPGRCPVLFMGLYANFCACSFCTCSPSDSVIVDPEILFEALLFKGFRVNFMDKESLYPSEERAYSFFYRVLVNEKSFDQLDIPQI